MTENNWKQPPYIGQSVFKKQDIVNDTLTANGVIVALYGLNTNDWNEDSFNDTCAYIVDVDWGLEDEQTTTERLKDLIPWDMFCNHNSNTIEKPETIPFEEEIVERFNEKIMPYEGQHVKLDKEHRHYNVFKADTNENIGIIVNLRNTRYRIADKTWNLDNEETIKNRIYIEWLDTRRIREYPLNALILVTEEEFQNKTGNKLFKIGQEVIFNTEMEAGKMLEEEYETNGGFVIKDRQPFVDILTYNGFNAVINKEHLIVINEEQKEVKLYETHNRNRYFKVKDNVNPHLELALIIEKQQILFIHNLLEKTINYG